MSLCACLFPFICDGVYYVFLCTSVATLVFCWVFFVACIYFCVFVRVFVSGSVCVCVRVGQGSKHAAVCRPAVPVNGGAADDAAAADGGGPEVAGAGGKAAGNTHSEHSRKYTHKHTSHVVHGTHKEACSIENKPQFAAIFPKQ